MNTWDFPDWSYFLNTAVKRTQGMGERINFNRPRTNFPRKISKEKNKKQSAAISLDKRKKVETFVEICEKKTKIFNYSITGILLNFPFGALLGKLYAFKTPWLTGLCGCLWLGSDSLKAQHPSVT